MALFTDDFDTTVSWNNRLMIFVEVLLSVLDYRRMLLLKERLMCNLASYVKRNPLFEICSQELRHGEPEL